MPTKKHPLVEAFFLAFTEDREFAKAVYALAVQNSPERELEVANFENYLLSFHVDLVSVTETVEFDDSDGVDSEGREGIYSRNAVFTRGIEISVMTSTGSFSVPADAVPPGSGRVAWINRTLETMREHCWHQAFAALTRYRWAISRYPEFANPDQIKTFNTKFPPIAATE